MPILGEPLAVELANTLYIDGDSHFDFLGDAFRARVWLGAVPLGITVTSELASSDLARLVQLRDAVRRLVLGSVDGAPSRRQDVARINKTAQLALNRRTLRLDPSGVPAVGDSRRGALANRVLATLADDAIALIGGSLRSRIRRCPGPGCPMFFVQQHHRRRFCHESCSHRARQAAYYQRQRAGSTDA